jgi:ATPase subunit of ABC transporter with duplicated ATPase domains
MISTQGISLQYGGRSLFENVNVQFTAGNCYGLIGANGTGKSTFLRILSGELESSSGEISTTPGERIAVLRQDHYAFDEYTVLETVIMGYARLYEIMQKKEVLYAKTDFDDADGLLLAELEGEFSELDGWNAEPDAETLLNGLGITGEYYQQKMADLDGHRKVKVLLAQALFAKPDILLLDEPTNNLDVYAIRWLEEFLLDFPNTVIVVSHDRHFLNKVCTHIVDIDYGKMQMYVGNYDFWYEYTQLAARQEKDKRKLNEQKIKELQEFIQRFSANASKSRQATSRKKMLDNLQMDNFAPSSRRYPYIHFKPDREVGNDILTVNDVSKTVGGRKVLDKVSFVVQPGDKIVFVGEDEVARTTLFQILMGELEPDEGDFKWGVTTTQAYMPSDNTAYFDGVELTLVDWLRQYSHDQYESTIRGWLGRVMFSGEEALKKASVLSGGEKSRCMFAKMMLSGANVLIMNEPTNHLDLEAITALNEGMTEFSGVMLFASHDHQVMQTVANRVIELLPGALIDRRESYDEYIVNPEVLRQREAAIRSTPTSR